MSTRLDHELSAIAESGYLSVIERLYEAVTCPASWPAFVERLAVLLSCPGAHYLSLQRTTGRLMSSLFVGYSEEINRQYLDYWFPHDPRLTLLPGADSGHWACYHHVINEQEVAGRCFYRDFLAPVGIRYMTTLSGETHRGVMPVLTLFRGADQAPMGETESLLLEQLRPHFVRAMRLQLETQHLERRIQTLERTLHALDYPVLLVQKSGVVDFSNRTAREWLAGNGHFTLKDGEVKARNSEDQLQFCRLLRQAIDDRRCGILALRCPGGGKPWQMIFCPVEPESSHDTVHREESCLIIVANPNARASLTLENLQSLFGLTTATARVALGLAEGKSLHEIAIENGVSINTVRSQIKQVMDRTGSHRQAELVSVVSALPRLRRPK